MITGIFLGYFAGVVLAFVLLLIGNTLSVKCNESKAPLKCIFFTWLTVLYCIICILDMLNDKYLPFTRIGKFLNKKPDLLGKK